MSGTNQRLQSIGLSQNEERVYLFLLQSKEAKVSLISSKLNIPSSHIYDLLEKLLSKGIISFKIINNYKVFRPVNPENLFLLFTDKEKQIEKEKLDLKEFITNLKETKFEENKANDFKYFEGINGIKSMFSELIESLIPNSKMYISSAPLAYEKWNNFLLEHFHPPRIKKKVHLELIVPLSVKSYGKEREKLKYIEIKYSDLDMESEFGVAGNYTYFLSRGEKPYALLIKDPNFAKTQNKVFQIMWRAIKK